MADQPFASFEVCGQCYELRGPFDYTWKDAQYTFVQECRCERDARPRDERPPTWISFDFNAGAELCHGIGDAEITDGVESALNQLGAQHRSRPLLGIDDPDSLHDGGEICRARLRRAELTGFGTAQPCPTSGPCNTFVTPR